MPRYLRGPSQTASGGSSRSMVSRRSRVDTGSKMGIGRTLLVAALLRSVTSTSAPAETSPRADWAWQSNLTTLHERLQHLYTSGRYSDLTIGFSSDNKTVSVHRLVLSLSSPVFEPMLMGPSPVGEELVLQDPPEPFTKLLNHMYLDQMDLESVDEAIRVYATSYKYQVHSSNKMCSEYIRNHLTEETTLAAMEVAVDFDDVALREKCVMMLNRNPDAAIAPSSVLHLRKETLRGILQGDLYVSSETRIFDAVLAWGRSQLSQRGEEPSSSALRKEVEDLLREVRFLTMTCEEFIDSVLPPGVFSPAEAIHLLRAIRGADVSLIPEATPFSPSNKSRVRTEDTLIKVDVHCNARYHSNYIYSDDKTTIIDDFKSTELIYIQSLQINYNGIISIKRKDGAEVASVRSQNKKFTFQVPVPLEPDETYIFLFQPNDRIAPYEGSNEVKFSKLPKTTLSYRSRYCVGILIFFWLG